MQGSLSDTDEQQRQQQADVILSAWLAAWQEVDPAARLAACARCKLDSLAWQQRWEVEPQALATADPADS